MDRRTNRRSIRKFVRTIRCYRTIEIQADASKSTTAAPLPDDLREALDASVEPVSVRINLS